MTTKQRRRHSIDSEPSSTQQVQDRPPASPSSTRAWDSISSVSFRSSVSRALLRADRSPSGLLSFEDLPSPWRANKYILQGYRFRDTLIATFLSPVTWHNETVNIWTHFIPILLVLRYPLSITPLLATFRDGGLGHTSDAVIAGLYFGCAVASLWCSTLWHTFRCSARVRLLAAFSSVDIMAVALILTAFNILAVHVIFYNHPTLRARYLVSDALWCLGGVILPWTDAFRPRQIAALVLPVPTWWPLSRGWNRVVFFCGLGFQGLIVPVLHAWLAIEGGREAARVLAPMAASVAGPIFVGSWLYGSKMPERLWPGKFDFCGSSHNYWHIATAISALNGCRVMPAMFQFAWERVRDTQ